ncbi:MAG: molybdopterin biosynthesis protein [Desulfarculus sp.]|nr:molybdopterin biosynthesis protein [Desulfarculus sp.]
MKRHIYLEMKPLIQARREFLAAFDWIALVGEEEAPTVEALGRVTAWPVFANYSSPTYHAAAMDGIAVEAEDTFGAAEDRPLLLPLGQKAHMVNTGQPLPPGCNAVVMIEQVHQTPDGQMEIRAAAFPWQHVRKVGEDMVAHEMILPHHHRLCPQDLAALLTAGVFRVPVLQRPRVAIMATGSELLDWQQAEDSAPASGAIIEANATFLASLVRECGGEAIILPRQPDQFESIREALAQALASQAHIVVLNAGASAGSKDFTAHVLDDLGEVLVHGVTAMPGKPSILGRAQNKPVVGSPGYPVSAWVCFDQFLRPALSLMQGQQPSERPTLEVVAARPLPSKLGQEEFLRVHLGRVGENVVATPLKRGAGTITSLTRADGILRIPAESEGLEEGARARAELLKPRWAVEETLVVVGSHDVTLDLLADHMKTINPRLWMSSSNVGSLAGLMALKAGRSHLGGTHLLDTETGDYNVSYLQKHLAGLPVVLVTLAWRQQGLMVKKGNPKGIGSLADLTRPEVTFVNRQAGSGTRVLLDYYLAREGINPAQIKGYRQDEYTHTAVAVQVLSGGADCGLGILAAAKALGLDFVPLCPERYDLCIPQAFLDDHRVKVLLDTLQSKNFRQAVEALGGYDISPMGHLAWRG